MLELITSFEEALANAETFQGVSEHTHSKAFINLDHFFHWYYFPEQEIFAPSKFIGYRDADIEGYTCHGKQAHDAQEALARWFMRLDPDMQGFHEIQDNLERFLSTQGSHLHVKSREATGGIYVPRDYRPE